MNIFKNLAKKRDSTGALTGKTIRVGGFQVKVEAIIGEGGFATIYRAVEVNTRAIFALKHFMLSGDADAERDVQTEVAVMKALRTCPSILALRAAAMSPVEAYVLVDLCVSTLAQHVAERGGGMSTPEVLHIFLPVCRAVQAMHSMNPPLAHRDVKAENILLHPDGRWLLCDFGSASHLSGILDTALDISREEERVRKQTTPAYRAPELWDLYARQPIGPGVDVWALGCLLYLLCYGRLPFDGEAKLQVLNGVYHIPAGRPPVIEAVIKCMLVVDPLARASVDEVVEQVVGIAPPDVSRPLPGVSHARVSPPRSSQTQQQGGGGPMAAAAAARHRAAAPATSTTTTAGGTAASRQPPLTPQQQPPQQQEAEGLEGWATFGNSPQASPARPAATAERSPPKPSQPAAQVVVPRPASANGSSASGSHSRPVTPEESLGAFMNAHVSSRPASAQGHPASARPPSSASIGSSAGSTVPQVQTLVDALAPEVGALDLHDSELGHHCRVLEQLLEDRGTEMAALRAKLQDYEAEVKKLRAGRAEADALRREVMTLRAEVQALKEAAGNQKQRELTATGSHGRMTSGGSGGVTSFPIADANLVTPMRPGAKASGGEAMRRPGHTRTQSASASAFEDLNPLG